MTKNSDLDRWKSAPAGQARTALYPQAVYAGSLHQAACGVPAFGDDRMAQGGKGGRK